MKDLAGASGIVLMANSIVLSLLDNDFMAIFSLVGAIAMFVACTLMESHE